MTTVSFTDDVLIAFNHSGKTGACIAISTAVQVAARMLNEAGCVAEITMDAEPPMFRCKLKGKNRLYVRTTIEALWSVLREIQEANPRVLQLVRR